MNNTQIFVRSVRIFLKKDKKDKLGEFLKRLHPADIADVLDRLDEREKIDVFELLETQTAAEVISEVNNFTRDVILDSLSRHRITELVESQKSDEAAQIVGELSGETQSHILKKLPEQEAKRLKRILKFHSGTAGSIMQAEFLSVPSEFNVSEAVKYVRSRSKNIDDVHNLFVTEQGLLIGTVPLQRLITAEPKDKVTGVMEPDFVTVQATDDQEYVATIFKKYDLISVAVVDEEKRIVGRITVDDILEVLEEESTEDMYKLAGLSIDESVHDSAMTSVRRRLPWLVINLATAVLAGAVVGVFQSTIAAVVAIAVFMPMVAGMGGNAGTQTLTVVVRGIALGEMSSDTAKKVLRKEIAAGIINGAVIGLITSGLALLWKKSPMLGLIVFLAISLNMIVAAFVGTLVPIILKAMKIDPALASSVIVTTFTDVVGFFALLGLSAFFINFL